jgi:hypothetical protein
MISPKNLAPNLRVASRPLPKAIPPKTRRMTNGRWLASAAAMLVAGVGLVWIVGHFWKDTRIADMIELQEKLLDPSLSAEDRQAIQENIHRRQESLMPELRKKVMDGSVVFMELMIGHMNQVLALPDDKRMAAVDQDLDNMKSMSRMFGRPSDRASSSKDSKPPSSNWPGAQSTDAQRTAFRNQLLSSIPADSRAQFQIYSQVMQARAMQRGIDFPPGGPH